MCSVKRLTYGELTTEFGLIDSFCCSSKNIYNTALYYCHMFYLETGGCPSQKDLVHKIVEKDEHCYRWLPTRVADATIRMARRDVRNFLKNKENGFPRFLGEGERQIVYYDKGALSFKARKGYVCPSKSLDIPLPDGLNEGNIKFVRYVRDGRFAHVEIGYKQQTGNGGGIGG